MSDPKTLGLGCSFVEALDVWRVCGREDGTVRDPRQPRYDIGLCPRHLALVQEREQEVMRSEDD